jgi:FAD/FMN-containing dehydrogenase/Fe-S oxidoreductase
LDATRRRIRDDFRGHFHGDLLVDPVARGLYATDASLFEIEPLAVAVPRDIDDLAFLVRYAFEKQIPVIPRGAGTGVAGEALGSGLVVDLSTHFRTIVEIGADFARVQPGVVLRNLNVELARRGRRFAPDPASAASCTIGGMLATNASGSNIALHGYVSDHVAALDVIWDNGETGALRRPKSHFESPNGKPALEQSGRTEEIASAVRQLLLDNAAMIEATGPKTPYNRCGYHLHGVNGPHGLDLARLLIGSEGTLAFFTEAALRTLPLPNGRSAVLFGFDSLDAAIRAADFVRRSNPASCDLLDRRLLTLTRGRSPEMAKLIPAVAEAVMLVEFERDDQDEARQAGLDLIDSLQRLHRLALLALPAFDDEAIERLWHVREAALPALYTLGKGPRPLAFVEDIGVPPEALGEFLNRLQTILQRFETTASYLIHAATGQVHARPFLDLADPGHADKLWAIADQVHNLAIDLGGTISAQHGTGLARTPWVERQYGRLFPVFRELKRIFDPQGILNPGKIVGPDPSRPAWPLRKAVGSGQSAISSRQPVADNEATSGSGRHKAAENGTQKTQAVKDDGNDSAKVALKTSVVRQLIWQTDELEDHVTACNGCGTCRTEDFQRRMCPMYRVEHGEAASPRAKANLLRNVLTSDPAQLGADEVREVADFCVNCKMCAYECPAHVNVPKLMLEAKAANCSERGLDRSDWLLARMESVAALGSTFAMTTNLLMGNRLFRWVMEWIFGLSRRRMLPTFAGRNFLKRAKRKGWTRKRRAPDGVARVAYFVDIFANYNDPLLAEATVAVLRHNGIDVLVPPNQKGSGMAALAQGDSDSARDTVLRNVRVFAELARDGYTILCSEPTAALMLRQDALDLTDNPDALLMAEHTLELTAFLWQLREQGRLRTDFQPIEMAVGHHVPCHVKALGLGIHGPKLLELIPGLTVHTIDVSCSGMAGTFGLKAKNFTASLEAGKPMLDELGRPRVLFGSTECGSCRMQMEQGSGKRTLHPVQYLALAYGLLPEIARKLREPLRGLVSPL